jgi:biotin carboxylase
MRDLGAAWAETLAAAEPRYRASSATQPSYLVESRMRGREVSVETFVKSGTVGFGNVTEKIVLDGEFPVEMGHVVPARRLTDETVALLHSSVRQLVGATGFQTGVLHSEWMIDGSGVPGLVECAARIPGDGIDRLISLAYDFDFVAAWIGMLLGGPLPAPRRECAGAAVEYFQAPASPKGAQLATEELLRFDGVASGAVAAYEKSDRGIRDSSDRNGYVICRGGDADAAFLAARQASAHAQAVLSRS